jgi:hypothetical protein
MKPRLLAFAMRYALAIAALLALPVDASAEALIPKEMQGTWCGWPFGEDALLSPPNGPDDPCEKTEVHARGFRAEGLDCTATKVTALKRLKDRHPRVQIKVKCGKDSNATRWQYLEGKGLISVSGQWDG